MRVYGISYDEYAYKSGAGKYALNPEFESNTIFYTFDERQQWINKYKKLKNDSIYYDNVKCWYAELKDITDNMEEIIKGI